MRPRLAASSPWGIAGPPDHNNVFSTASLMHALLHNRETSIMPSCCKCLSTACLLQLKAGLASFAFLSQPEGNLA